MRLAVLALLALVLIFAQATSHMSAAADIVNAAEEKAAQPSPLSAEDTETEIEEEDTDEEDDLDEVDDDGDLDEEMEIDEDTDISERKRRGQRKKKAKKAVKKGSKKAKKGSKKAKKGAKKAKKGAKKAAHKGGKKAVKKGVKKAAKGSKKGGSKKAAPSTPCGICMSPPCKKVLASMGCKLVIPMGKKKRVMLTPFGVTKKMQMPKGCVQATCTKQGWQNKMPCSSAPGPSGPCATCHSMANCTITNTTTQAYRCDCKPGFGGSGKQCADINECAKATSCAKGAACTNTPGSFSCACKPGYQGDGKTTCTDIDECKGNHTCDKTNAKCTNIPGSYTCKCNAGWCGDGVKCTEWNKNPSWCKGNATAGVWSQQFDKNITGENYFIMQATEKQHRGVRFCEDPAKKLICCNAIEFVGGYCRYFFIPDVTKLTTAYDKGMDISVKTSC